MKNIKKLLSILMVLTLVLALGANAFAATVKIDKPVEGHTYVAYQIFSGTTTDITDDDGNAHEVLASIQWANESGSVTLLAALNEAFPNKFPATLSAEEAAKAMVGLTTAEQKQALARVLAADTTLLGESKTIVSGETELDPGYYAIVDTTNVAGEDDAKNAIVLEVVGSDVTVNSKYDVPEAEKKVQDDGEDDWQDGADWDIGDKVPFQITGTLPTNLNEYETYELIFHDVQSEGLTFDPDSVEVTVGGQPAAKDTDYTVVVPADEATALEDGCTFEIKFTDIKAVTGADNSAKIVVSYYSTLNDKAVIGGTGNSNTMQMEFSNNPGGEGTGKTPEDKVTVFTFALDVNKVDGKTQPLAGAAFTLFKEVPSAEGAAEGQPYTSLKDEDGDPITLNKGDYYKVGDKIYQVVGTTEAGAATEFNFEGLDDGNYLLIETTVPDGYNKADDITFTVTDSHTEDDKNTGKQEMGEPKVEVTSGKAEITVEEATGHLKTTVVNANGLELPETGGIGTTIFYVVGGILVVAAVILLVTRRRVSGSEK